MANIENLKPFTSEQNREEAVKNGQKGGIASGKARRKKKLFSELAQIAMGTKPTPKMIKAMQTLGFEEEDITQKAACVMWIIVAAQKGDVRAFEKLQELTGELQNKDGDTIEDLTPLKEMLSDETWTDYSLGAVFRKA